MNVFRLFLKLGIHEGSWDGGTLIDELLVSLL